MTVNIKNVNGWGPRSLPGGFNSAGQGRPLGVGGSPRGTSPRRWLAPAGRISSAAVRRDRLWVGLERLGAKVARDFSRVLYSALRPDLAASRGRGQSVRCALSPPRGRDGAPCYRCDCQPGRTVLSALRPRRAVRAGIGSHKRRQGSAAMSATHPNRLETRTKEREGFNASSPRCGSGRSGMERPEDTLIIDTSNAPCGPGFLPGLRLSEGRFAINRKTFAFLSGWGVAGGLGRLRPPKCIRFGMSGAVAWAPGPPSSPSAQTPFFLLSHLGLRVRAWGAPSGSPLCVRGCRWTFSLRAARVPPGACHARVSFGERGCAGSVVLRGGSTFDYDLRSDETTR
ncbi:hypothetical protein NQZ68_040485 [Dissostichus eleginoides]|nr:hypothetical protein NQZ68_040485 [Dissostichus eleginoides]